MNKFDFKSDLEFSMGENAKLDTELIRQAIPDCTAVYLTDKETNKKGIDYIAVLDHGAKINIDAKRRKPGTVKMIGGYPELALEVWSQVPGKGSEKPSGAVGWACKRSSDVDMILYAFDKSDWDKFYIVPFQLLRVAFKRHYTEWYRKYGPPREQPNPRTNPRYFSMCQFIPANVLIQAVSDEMTHNIL